MQICHSVEALRQARQALSGRVGFVPTMGALHQGHMALIHEAKRHADHVIVSIFVNPTQFGPNEDFDAYPRDLEADAAKCEAAGATLIFAPQVAQMYPEGAATFVEVEGMDANLCGPHRPGHFRGVTTIVSKLFNAVRPDVAVFGQKDYQQLAIIRRMTQDLLLPIEIVGLPTVREDDGLAMSSRNRYMDAQTRADALAVSRGLALAWQAWQQGVRDAATLSAFAREAIGALGYPSIDYVEAVHPDTLHPLQAQDTSCVVAVAARFHKTRLIDNLRLDQPLPKPLLRHVDASLAKG